MAKVCNIPKPSAFLDPLTEVNNCYYYAIPKFFPLDHANTRWLLSMLRNDRVDKVKRKMELQPGLFRTSYFQLLDCPQLYNSRDPSAPPIFHRQAVLYLSFLGMAIYLKSAETVKLILEYRDPSEDQLYGIDDPQYATHVQDMVLGDFNAYPVSIIMLRTGFFEYATDLLAAKWNPLEPICMPARRRYERRAFYYLDWLDYALCLMNDRPLLPLAKLVHYMTSNSTLYKCQQLPMVKLKPASEEDRVQTGLIEVDNLPVEARMLGVKSLLELVEDYSVYMQCKDRYQEIRNCVTEMRCDGINPEVMMARALDFDGGDPNGDGSGEVPDVNANNNAARSGSKSRKGKKVKVQEPYASEPTRILLHALQTDAKAHNKTPLHPLLDSVAVYIKRNIYLVNPPIRSKGEKLSADEKKAQDRKIELHKRDAKNTIILLLNLMQQQLDKIDKLNKIQREKREPRFKHVDSAKLVNNKRVILARNIKRIAGLLFLVMLHSRELLDFVEASFPPYNYAADEVDFQLNPALEQRLRSLQLEIMAEFSASKTASHYLSIAEMERAVGIKEVYLNLRLGKPPPIDLDAPEKFNKNKGGKRNPKNSSNVNGSSITSQHNSPSEECCHLLLGGDKNGCDAIPAARHGHVSFVRVKRRLKAKDVEETAEEEEVAATETAAQAAAPSAPEEVKKADEGGDNAGGGIAARLYDQIDQLRRSAQGADATLAEIYTRIVDDLNRAVTGGTATVESQAMAQVENEASEEAVPPTEEDDGESGATKRRVVVRRAVGGGKKWRCRPARGSAGAGASGWARGRRSHWYQKARVYEAPPEGSEFDLDST